ncbi:hypothetical protein L6452_31706 [Arctium lappa]|uniref:Uncharacterized protein n=1 Tax=Arctium lappa TaxID=4217 RepID=A0ACB8Z2R9_ARCLA|nr:hypothetical protein L6452_31706 [Arctium lappa]
MEDLMVPLQVGFDTIGTENPHWPSEGSNCDLWGGSPKPSLYLPVELALKAIAYHWKRSGHRVILSSKFSLPLLLHLQLLIKSQRKK